MCLFVIPFFYFICSYLFVCLQGLALFHLLPHFLSLFSFVTSCEQVRIHIDFTLTLLCPVALVLHEWAHNGDRHSTFLRGINKVQLEMLLTSSRGKTSHDSCFTFTGLKGFVSDTPKVSVWSTKSMTSLISNLFQIRLKFQIAIVSKNYRINQAGKNP